jgi:hypothetical protein
MDVSGATEWRRSKYSTPNNDCVELALGEAGVRVRDSKHPGPELSFATTAFSAFRGSLKRDPARS